MIPDRVPNKNGYIGVTIGGVGRKGRGVVGPGRRTTAHRASWERTYGPIPDGMWVLHHCDNRPCDEPTHLFLGTHLDNMADMWAKGRSKGISKATHCRHGHEFTPENTYMYTKDGRPARACAACRRDATRRYDARRANRRLG